MADEVSALSQCSDQSLANHQLWLSLAQTRKWHLVLFSFEIRQLLEIIGEFCSRVKVSSLPLKHGLTIQLFGLNKPHISLALIYVPA